MAKKLKIVKDPNAYKKKKKNKGKKSYSDKTVYQSFNALDYKSLTAESLIESLYTNAANILIEYGLPVNVWFTFTRLENQLKKTWDAEECFIRFWLDRIVDEFGYMIWNEVNRKYFNVEYHGHGILHDVPELSKKLRSNPEAVATHFADSAVTKYQEYYK